MKTNHLLLTVWLAAMSLSAHAQEQKIEFKNRYKPQHSYHQVIFQKSNSKIVYKGKPEVLEALKSQHIRNPSIKSDSSETIAVYRIGEKKGEIFPVVIEFVKTEGEEGEKTIPDGTLIYGHGKSDALPVIDSIKSDGMDPELKDMVQTALRSLFKQLELPEMKLGIGDSYKHKSPFVIPVGDINITMTTVTKYTLTKISQDTAFFDTEQEVDLKTDKIDMSGGQKMKIKVSGSGTGKILYDINNNFSIRETMTLDMISEATISEISITITSTNSSVHTTNIVADNPVVE